MKMQILKFFKTKPWILFWILAIVMAAVILTVIYPAYNKAEQLGIEGGSLLGKAAGKCIGSVEGIAVGVGAGAEAGEQEGLSAKDTEVKIIERVRELGNLEVLNVSMKRNVINEADGGKTCVLWSAKCEASYAVDLTKAEISNDKDKIIVIIPYPELSISFDSPEKIAQYQKRKNTGSSINGSTEYINSENEIRDKIQKELKNNSDLSKKAQDAAINQVKILIKNISVKGKQINVEFGEASNNAGE